MNKKLQERVQHLLQYRIMWHVGFWVLYIFFDSLGAAGRIFDGTFALFYFTRVVGFFFFAYVILFGLYPYFFAKGQFLGYGLAGLAMSIFMAIYQTRIYSWFRLEGYEHFDAILAVPFNVFFFFLITFMKLAKEYYFNIQRQAIEKQQKMEQELEFLKAQIAPHFLFNTLNNLYGLSVVKSDLLPPLMLRLSDLLRYSLYETNRKYVPLSHELKYIENYIELETIRTGGRLEVHLHLPQIDGQQIEIAPGLLIVFIENAFKHSRLVLNEKIKIDISLKVETDWIDFQITNNYANHEVGDSSGIGISNVKKRLAHLYPLRHMLEIEKTASLYSVTLRLKYIAND